jgi:hypothetical protein
LVTLADFGYTVYLGPMIYLLPNTFKWSWLLGFPTFWLWVLAI